MSPTTLDLSSFSWRDEKSSLHTDYWVLSTEYWCPVLGSPVRADQNTGVGGVHWYTSLYIVITSMMGSRGGGRRCKAMFPRQLCCVQHREGRCSLQALSSPDILQEGATSSDCLNLPGTFRQCSLDIADGSSLKELWLVAYQSSRSYPVSWE